MSPRSAWVIVAAVGLAGCGANTVKVPRTRMTVKEMVERSKPAIVHIDTKASDGERVGTGFAVDPSGVIATNLHVVAGSSDITVTMLDHTSYKVTRIVGYDPNRDLALIGIDPGHPLPVLKIGDSDAVEAGDPVVAIGNPVGLDDTVSDGLISSVRNFSDGSQTPELTVLQISAPISPGSSGGPLFNPYGEVIGLATAIFTQGQNLNFAVPSKYLAHLIQAPNATALDEFARQTAAPDENAGGQPKVHIERKVPVHDVSVLDGCSNDQMADIVKAINDAIDLGAPLYNQGNFAACYKIYEGTSLEQSTKAACPGVRQAFKDGLARAGTLTTDDEKAWALRDTFDGLLDVIVRKAHGATSQP